MPRVCSVCVHPERDAIDRALVAGGTYRDIAGQYGVARSSVQRHKDAHIPATLAKAQEAAEVAHADDLLAEVRRLQTITMGVLGKAGQTGDFRTMLQAVREARGKLELLGRLLGELQAGTTVNILMASPEWVSIRGAIMRALEAHPAARLAVAEALQHVCD